ncbi:MAG: hypothetical protein IJN29_05345 [Akkermansia sp.]|nr:hypothetical protein [Akkermansia sp.]
MSSWIKVQVTLPESPKIFRLARLLGVGRMEALGYAVRWFCWLDTHCAHGATELQANEVDALVGREGVTAAFCELGWASVDAEGYVLVLEFDKHNGESSKRRAETQGRVAAYRERQRAGSECNAKGVTGALPEGEGDSNKEGCVGKAVLNSAAPAEPAPTPDGFAEWLAGLCRVHPSASKSRTLAPDVREAALAAFGRCPDAVAHAELLGAYFKDGRLAEHGFYAPRGQRKFFVDLEDVVAHAERWRKWAGWKPKKRKADEQRSGVVKTPGCEVKRCAGVMTDEEREAFFRELRG